MAGRGRGRGKTVSFDVQALGFGRGEALPAASSGPPALFPPQQYKPVPLEENDGLEYMLALKQEFFATLRKSPYFMKEHEKKRDIERYSDKYQINNTDGNDIITPDWNRLPSELKIKSKKVRKVTSIKPNIPTRKTTTVATDIDVTKTLESLEKTEGEVTEVVGEDGEKEEDEEKEEEEEGVDLEGEVYDDEDLEEETDYAQNYFDNGEGYGDDDADDDEGPVY